MKSACEHIRLAPTSNLAMKLMEPKIEQNRECEEVPSLQIATQNILMVLDSTPEARYKP